MDIVKDVKKETDTKASKFLFLVCFLVYTCGYIARGNYSVVVDLMKNESIINDSYAGLISAVYFICYTLGQFINGMIADRKSPFWMVTIGASIIIISQALMTLSIGMQPLMVASWGLNGIGQSMLWSPIFYVLNNALNERHRFKAVTLMALTMPVGKILSYFLSALSLDLSNSVWQSVFHMASIVTILSLSLWITTNVSLKKRVVYEEKKEQDKKKKSIGKLFVSTGMIAIIPVMMVHGLFLNGATEWVPTIIQNRYNVSSSVSGYLMMVVPFAGVGGVFLCNFFYEKVFKGSETKTGILFMILTLILIGILYLINRMKSENTILLCVLFVVCYALIYLVQLGFNHIVISLIPMHFVSLGLASTFSGTLNAINYGGSAISTYAISFITDNTDVLFIIWATSLLIAIISLFIFKPKWDRFSSETPISK